MVTKIQILKNKKLKNPVLLVGLPGIGLVGKIALDYLVNELKPKPTLFAKVTSDSFPPAVHAKNSLLELINDEIHVYSYKNRDYLFLIGPVQPSLASSNNSNQHYEFAESIALFAKKNRRKRDLYICWIKYWRKKIKSKTKSSRCN